VLVVASVLAELRHLPGGIILRHLDCSNLGLAWGTFNGDFGIKLLSPWAFDRCEETASCSQQDVYVCSTRSPRFTFHSPARRNAGEKSEYLSVICSVGIGGVLLDK